MVFCGRAAWSWMIVLGMAVMGLGCAPSNMIRKNSSASDLDQANARAHLARGIQLLVEQSQAQSAQEEFGQAVALDPFEATHQAWAAWSNTLQLNEEQAFENALQGSQIDTPQAELLMWMAYELAASRPQVKRLAAVLQQWQDRLDSNPLLKARAQFLLGHVLRSLGRFEPSAQVFAKLRSIRDWMVVGPFENDQNSGFDKAYPPEKGFVDFHERYPGKLKEVGWRRVDHFDFDDRVNLAALLDPSQWSCAYLATFIESPSEQEVAFRLAAFRGVKLWLNGRLLLADDEAQVASFDQYVVGGRLEKGANRLLCKVCQRQGPWQLGLRVTELDGNQISGLTYSTKLRPTPDRSSDTAPLPQPKSFSAWLLQQPDEPSGSSLLFKTLWNLWNGFYPHALESATALAERHPRCPLYLLTLARVHFASEHPDSALKTIRAAEKLAPGLPAAVLEQVRYERNHRRPERALRQLQSLLSSLPDNPAIRAEHLTLLSDRSFTVDALDSALKFLALQPERAATWRSVGSLHRSLNQPEKAIKAFGKAMDLDPSRVSVYDALVDLYVDLGEIPSAMRLLRQKRDRFPALITGALREAEILLSRNDYREALAVCRQVEQIAPDYWYLHQLRGDILVREGKHKDALASYGIALQLRPDNPRLREYVDFLDQHPDPAFERYRLGESEIEAALADRPKAGAFPDAAAVSLLDDEITHVFHDGSSRHQVVQIYLVQNEKGQRSLNQFSVPASPSFRLEVAETIQPDGSRQEATSIRSGVIHFPSLQPGSILHVAYRYDSPPTSWMEDHFAQNFNFQGSYPSRQARWVLVLPADKTLRVHKVGSIIEERMEPLDQEKAYIWTAKNAPMIHAEPMQPPPRLHQAAVYVSTVPSWDTLAQWQNSLIEDQFQIDEPIRKKTRELTSSSETTLAKVQAIYEFVSRDIRYLYNDMGIFGKKPDKAVNVFTNHYGDCKDKATLMIAMLQELGIKAAYAAVRTRDQGPVFWEVPYAQTNHIITYLPAQPGIDQPLFLDGTSRFGHFLYLPDQDQGLEALVLDGQGYQRLTTPVLPQDSSLMRTAARVRLGPSDSLLINADEQWSGWFAIAHRSSLNVEGKRLEELGKELSYRYPGAKLLSAEFHDLDTLGPSAGSHFEIQVPGKVRREDDALRISLLWPSNLSRSLAQEPQRRNDLFLGIRWSVQTQVTMELPQGTSVRKLPQAVSIDNDLLRFEFNCRQDKNSVLCLRSFQLKTREISKEKYSSFRELCNQIDTAEAQEIVLAK